MHLNPAYSKYKIGQWSYGKPTINDYGMPASAVTIGKFCSIGGGTLFIRGQHSMDIVSTGGVALYLTSDRELRSKLVGLDPRGDITVGNDVWIGYNVILMPNVTIGDGAVIGASAVVTRDIPPYAVAVGVPARVHHIRFPPDVVEALLRIRWWDWPDDVVRARIADIQSNDVAGFVARYDPLKAAASAKGTA